MFQKGTIKTVDIVEAAESGDFEFVLAALEREESPDSTVKKMSLIFAVSRSWT